MTSVIPPPDFNIYIEESFLVKALEKRESKIHSLLYWCNFIYINFIFNNIYLQQTINY